MEKVRYGRPLLAMFAVASLRRYDTGEPASQPIDGVAAMPLEKSDFCGPPDRTNRRCSCDPEPLPCSAMAERQWAKVGTVSPDFALRSAKGEVLTLSHMRGQPAV